MQKSLRTEFEEGIRPGGEADAGGVIGSCEFPPQGLQEAEGHGCWTLAGADSHAGHIPRRRNAETEGRHLHYPGTDPCIPIPRPDATLPQLWTCSAPNSLAPVCCIHIVSSARPTWDCAFTARPLRCRAVFASDGA